MYIYNLFLVTKPKVQNHYLHARRSSVLVYEFGRLDFRVIHGVYNEPRVARSMSATNTTRKRCTDPALSYRYPYISVRHMLVVIVANSFDRFRLFRGQRRENRRIEQKKPERKKKPKLTSVRQTEKLYVKRSK